MSDVSVVITPPAAISATVGAAGDPIAVSVVESAPITVTVSNMPGAKGDTGPKGDTGDPGNTGPKGDTGDPGPKGDPGNTGPKGDKGDAGDPGPKGDTGNTGPKGDTGNTGAAGSDATVTYPTVIAALGGGGALTVRYDASQPEVNCLWVAPSGQVVLITGS